MQHRVDGFPWAFHVSLSTLCLSFAGTLDAQRVWPLAVEPSADDEALAPEALAAIGVLPESVRSVGGSGSVVGRAAAVAAARPIAVVAAVESAPPAKAAPVSAVTVAPASPTVTATTPAPVAPTRTAAKPAAPSVAPWAMKREYRPP